MEAPLVVARDYDLPRVIVWDALVDPDLLEGWLGEVSLVRESEGGPAVSIRWRERHHAVDFVGRVARCDHLERLEIAGERGRIRAQLDEVEGGTRGTSSRLTLAVDLPLAAAPRRERAHWAAHLEALEDLLRAHPVSWRSWDADYGDVTDVFARTAT